MSYQVLARKWRPKSFAELSGQAHVVTALTNALTTGRLHHAYLLTGTRGVGKTTIARILAKSLNCETGVTATPCGICSACVAIDEGRFVDLLELDAASHTGIDNMREILDNARYAPTVGRYKVYLIDEVHQLSKAAFNSMLKTLEEPPEHVKFVLATTDPQKIPVTVLSRCLQFNLKPLPFALIEARLKFILDAESIGYEEAALAAVAKAADGSLRDALSLLDQGIAFGAGQVQEAVIRTMLGVVDREHIYRIVAALNEGNGVALLAEADGLVARGLSGALALEELASLFHRIAVAQVVPESAANLADAAQVAAFARSFTPAAIQLCYQICVQGRSDLALSPDESTGFSMTLLRLLAFEPATAKPMPPSGIADMRPAVSPGAPVRQGMAAAVNPVAASPAVRPVVASATASPSVAPSPHAARPAAASASPSVARAVDAPLSPAPSASPATQEAAERPPARPLPETPGQWASFVAELGLSGMAAQLAAQTELQAITGNALTLSLPATHKHLADKVYADKLKAALERATGRRVLLAFEVGAGTESSLAAIDRRERAEAQAKGEAAFRDEPFVRALLSEFDGEVKPDTITPLPREHGAKRDNGP